MQAGAFGGPDEDELQRGGQTPDSVRRKARQSELSPSTEEGEVQPITALPVAPMEGGFWFWHVGLEGSESWGGECFPATGRVRVGPRSTE